MGSRHVPLCAPCVRLALSVAPSKMVIANRRALVVSEPDFSTTDHVIRFIEGMASGDRPLMLVYPLGKDGGGEILRFQAVTQVGGDAVCVDHVGMYRDIEGP